MKYFSFINFTRFHINFTNYIGMVRVHKKISDEKRKFIAKALADGKMTVKTASIF